jgi:hypothetical protein
MYFIVPEHLQGQIKGLSVLASSIRQILQPTAWLLLAEGEQMKELLTSA